MIESLRLLAPEIGVRSLGLVGAPGVDLAAEMVPVLVDELSDLPAPLVVALDSLEESRAFLNGQLGLELGDAEVRRLRAGGRAGADAGADLSHL